MALAHGGLSSWNYDVNRYDQKGFMALRPSRSMRLSAPDRMKLIASFLLPFYVCRFQPLQPVTSTTGIMRLGGPKSNG